jgi:hypothetical protein
MKPSVSVTLIIAGACLMIAPLVLSYHYHGKAPAAFFQAPGFDYHWLCFFGGAIAIYVGSTHSTSRMTVASRSSAAHIQKANEANAT